MKSITNLHFWFLVTSGTPSVKWFSDCRSQMDVVKCIFLDLFRSHETIAINLDDQTVKEEYIFLFLGPYQSSFRILSRENSSLRIVSSKPHANDSCHNTVLCEESYENIIKKLCREILKLRKSPHTDLYFCFETLWDFNESFLSEVNLNQSVAKCKRVFKKILPEGFTVNYFPFKLQIHLNSLDYRDDEIINFIDCWISNYKFMVFIDSDFFDKLKKKIKERIISDEDREIEKLSGKYLQMPSLTSKDKENLLVLSIFTNLKEVYKNSMTGHSISQSKDYLIILIKFLLNKKNFKRKLKGILRKNKEITDELVSRCGSLISKHGHAFSSIADSKADFLYLVISLFGVVCRNQINEMEVDYYQLICKLFLVLQEDMNKFSALVLSEDISELTPIREIRTREILSHWLEWSKRFVEFLKNENIEMSSSERNAFISLRDQCFGFTLSKGNSMSKYVYDSYRDYTKWHLEELRRNFFHFDIQRFSLFNQSDER